MHFTRNMQEKFCWVPTLSHRNCQARCLISAACVTFFSKEDVKPSLKNISLRMFLLHSKQSLHAELYFFPSLCWRLLPVTNLAPRWVGQTFLFLTCNWYFSWSWYPSSGWLPTSSLQLPLGGAHIYPKPLDHQTWYGRAHHKHYRIPQSHLLCSPAGCCQERRDHLQVLMHQRFKSLQVIQEQSSRAFTLPQPSCSLARHPPEHTDELGGHELWAELLHLCYIAQETQHVTMQLLFLWEFLSKQRTGLYKRRAENKQPWRKIVQDI